MIQKVKTFLFKNQTARQTVVKNTIWLSVSNVGGRLLRSVVIIYAARVLGAKDWGAFSYGITIIGLLAAFMDIGVNSILVRESAKTGDPVRREQIISTAFFIKLTLLLLGVFIVLFAAPYFITIKEVLPLLPAIALILFFDTLRDFASNVVRSLELMELEALNVIVTNIAVVAFGFLFLMWRPTAKSFAYSYALGTILGMGVAFWTLRDHFKNLISRFTGAIIAPILFAAWPVAIAQVMNNLLINTDVLILGWFRGATDVGYYSAANRILQIFYLLPAILGLSTIPLFARLVENDREKFRRVLERLLTVILLAAIPAAVGGLILGKAVMVLIFGGEYAPAGLPFQILALTLVNGFASGILVNAVFAHNRQKHLTAYSAIAGVSNVLFDLILIPHYGMIGSSFATLTSELISGAYIWYIMKHTQYFEIVPHLKNIMLGTLVMGATILTLLFLHTPLILNIALSSCVYFGILYMRREPVLKEIRSIFVPSLE